MPRRYRRKRSYTLSGSIKRYLMGILFVAPAAVIVSLTTYVSSVIPEANLTIGSITLSNKLFLNFIGFGVGVVVALSAIRKFGIRF